MDERIITPKTQTTIKTKTSVTQVATVILSAVVIAGLLGLFWLGVLGIFIGFYYLQKLKNKKLESLGVQDTKPKSFFD